jgi:hypothetical protein
MCTVGFFIECTNSADPVMAPPQGNVGYPIARGRFEETFRRSVSCAHGRGYVSNTGEPLPCKPP